MLFPRYEQEKQARKLRFQRRILYGCLVLAIIMTTVGVSGVVYTIISNDAHSDFSFSLGHPVYVTLVAFGSNASAINYTATAKDVVATNYNAVWFNVTIDTYPTGTNFTLTPLSAPFGPRTQAFNWITGGPFTLAHNEVHAFNFTLGIKPPVFGYYHITVNAVAT